MKRQKVDLIWLLVSMISFLLMSVSFLLMPIEKTDAFDEMSFFSYVSGIMFWLFLVAGIVTQIVLSRRREDWYIINRIRGKRFYQKIGVISFFQNTYAFIADIVTAVSLVSFIVALVITGGTGYICYVFLSLLVFSFCMHCVFNGKNYYYVINQTIMLKDIENERSKSEF